MLQSLTTIKFRAMKIGNGFLLLILLLGFGASINAQQTASGNKVKSIIVYQEKHDMLVTRKYKDLEQYYDSKGNLLEDITYKQGKIDKHFKYQYDSDNNKIREEEYDPSGRLIESSEYKYENGLRTEKTVYDQNKKIKSKKIYQYTFF
jgi:antitoxin component YwqK of YwqJK toxin-antitoxin module